MHRKRPKHHGRDQRESTIERCEVNAVAGPLKRARVKVQAGFRRYLAHGKFPSIHARELRNVHAARKVLLQMVMACFAKLASQ
jgi:hypothetical protein